MGDHDCGDTSELVLHIFDRLLHLCLILFIESTRCFVENENLGLLDEGTSQGNSLLLTSGELSTARATERINIFLFCVDKFVRVGTPQCCVDFGVCRIRFAKLDVLLDCRVEEDGLLANVADLITQLLQLNRLQGDSIKRDVSILYVLVTLHVVKALN